MPRPEAEPPESGPATAEASPPRRYRSKTLTAWLALLAGSLGMHRFYLHGARDRLAWVYPLPTLVGLAGVLRLRNLGTDDGWGALLVIPLGVTLSLAMLAAIRTALTPDERWDQRHNPGLASRATGWGAVLAAMAGLFLGATVLLSTIAFGGQRYFEWLSKQPDKAAAADLADPAGPEKDVRTASR